MEIATRWRWTITHPLIEIDLLSSANDIDISLMSNFFFFFFLHWKHCLEHVLWPGGCRINSVCLKPFSVDENWFGKYLKIETFQFGMNIWHSICFKCFATNANLSNQLETLRYKVFRTTQVWLYSLNRKWMNVVPSSLSVSLKFIVLLRHSFVWLFFL